MRLTFRAKLLASHVALALIAIGAVVFALDRSLGQDLSDRQRRRLEAQARGAATWIGQTRHHERLAPRLAAAVSARVTIIDADGAVLGDSDHALERRPALPNQGAAPEVVAALREGVGHALRTDRERGATMQYAAVSAGGGRVLRLGVPLSDIVETLGGVRRRLLFTAALACAAAIALGVLAARLAARPLRAMRRSAERIAEGDYDISVATAAPDDFGALSRSLAALAAQLKARIGDLTAQRDRLQRLEASRREFLANASHELRTPVTAIAGYAETLLSGPADPARHREFLETIQRHARRIGALVDGLLRLADAEARAPAAVPREPVALEPLARRVAATFAVRAGAPEIAVRVTGDATALGDPAALEQVVENLVDNAVRHGAGGRVTVAAERAGARVVLCVADEGPGIAPEHLPRIFDRFYRADPARSREVGGTGLGLAIVKELVASMEGAITVESEPGRGARFVLDLPAAAAVTASARTP